MVRQEACRTWHAKWMENIFETTHSENASNKHHVSHTHEKILRVTRGRCGALFTEFEQTRTACRISGLSATQPFKCVQLIVSCWAPTLRGAGSVSWSVLREHYPLCSFAANSPPPQLSPSLYKPSEAPIIENLMSTCFWSLDQNEQEIMSEENELDSTRSTKTLRLPQRCVKSIMILENERAHSHRSPVRSRMRNDTRHRRYSKRQHLMYVCVFFAWCAKIRSTPVCVHHHDFLPPTRWWS